MTANTVDSLGYTVAEHKMFVIADDITRAASKAKSLAEYAGMSDLLIENLDEVLCAVRDIESHINRKAHDRREAMKAQ